MAIIAKGSISLMAVNDALSVLLTPNVCVIRSNFDGTNPNLSVAQTTIFVVRGKVVVPCSIVRIEPSSSSISFQSTATTNGHRISITSIPPDILSGSLTIYLKTSDNIELQATFGFSVVKDGSTFDWLEEWNNNKTQIGSSYVVTPKIFAGVKESDGTLTGVYLGTTDHGRGIYGYNNGRTIFTINESGGLIGGWIIGGDFLQSKNQLVRILSSGDILTSQWGLKSDGSASFAGGNVTFGANGDAYFNGSVDANNGTIGGWVIGQNVLSGQGIALNSKERSVIVCASGEASVESLNTSGGVMMYRSNNQDFGIVGKVQNALGVTSEVFRLGSVNKIAGWNFDDTAFYIGNRWNVRSSYTSVSSHITIGTEGVRSYGWYLDSDGSASFARGVAKFNVNGGQISGWALGQNRMHSNNMVLLSSNTHNGVFLSSVGLSDKADVALTQTIQTNGGVFLRNVSNVAELSGYSGGDRIFHISTESNSHIGGWNIDSQSLFSGEQKTDGFTNSGITLSPSGVRGQSWRLETDGSGALANGNIQWGIDGGLEINSAVLSNALKVKGSDGVVQAGMLGEGDSGQSIRFFAGDSKPNQAPFRVTASGQLFATNARVYGGVSSPFKLWTSPQEQSHLGEFPTNNFIDQAYNNSQLFLPPLSDGSVVHLHAKTTNSQYTKTYIYNANVIPKRPFIAIDGVLKTQLVMRDGEVVQMLSANNNTMGQVMAIMHKSSLAVYDGNDIERYHEQVKSAGHTPKLLASGKVVVSLNADRKTHSVSSSLWQFDKYSQAYNALSGNGVEDVSRNIRVTRVGAGKYEILLPSYWRFTDSDLMVMVTGVGWSQDSTGSSTPIKATHWMTLVATDTKQTTITIVTSDDSTMNDGSFNFQIYNMAEWQ